MKTQEKKTVSHPFGNPEKNYDLAKGSRTSWKEVQKP